MHIKNKQFYKEMTDDVEQKFDTSNQKVERSITTGKKTKNVIRLNTNK